MAVSLDGTRLSTSHSLFQVPVLWGKRPVSVSATGLPGGHGHLSDSQHVTQCHKARSRDVTGACQGGLIFAWFAVTLSAQTLKAGQKIVDYFHGRSDGLEV